MVKEFHAKDLLFPRRLRSGAHKGELVWAELLQRGHLGFLYVYGHVRAAPCVRVVVASRFCYQFPQVGESSRHDQAVFARL